MADGYGTAAATETVEQALRRKKAELHKSLPEYIFTQCLCGHSKECDHCGGSGRKAPEQREKPAMFL